MTRLPSRTGQGRCALGIVGALAISVLIGSSAPGASAQTGRPAPTAAAAAHQTHRMSAPGVTGRGNYTRNGTDYVLRGYATDTAKDGYCAEVWLDFTTSPHEHHGSLMTYACGNGAHGWGDTRHATSPDHKIKSFRMAICLAHRPGPRQSRS